MLKLFKVLQIFIAKYSKMPTKDLMDHYLRIKIILKIPPASVDAYLSETDITKSQKTVFVKKAKSQKQSQFVLISFDHPHSINRVENILNQIQDCIVIDEDSSKQANNIILQEKKQIKYSKAILLKVDKIDYQKFIELLDDYLSIIQLFQGHIHAIINCFQAQYGLNIKKQLESIIDGDQFQGINDEGYFKILEERASKITMNEISNSCDMKGYQWGQTMVFQGGHDGIVVWVTENLLPKLNLIPSVSLSSLHAKKFPIYLQFQIGLKIFKNKQFARQKIQNLNFTTIIFNATKKWQNNMQQEIQNSFEQFSKKFFSNIVMNRQNDLLLENIKHGEKICSILGINGECLLKKLLQL